MTKPLRATGIYAGMAVRAPVLPFETMTREDVGVMAEAEALDLDPVTCCGRTFARFRGEDAATCFMAHRRQVHPEDAGG